MKDSVLLCTDLDRTVIPNGSQPESGSARPLFRRLAQHPDLKLAYVSGRDLELVRTAIADYELPTPDFIIGDVGTSIYVRNGANWEPDSNWLAQNSADWRGKTHESLKNRLLKHEQLKLQEAEKQKTFKLSFYVDLDADAQKLLAALSKELSRLDINASLIWSVDELADIGLLDVIPATATKRHAIEFLMAQHGFDISTTVFAGDSGNDLPVLLSPIHSVLVANADEGVKQEVTTFYQDIDNEHRATVYFARGGFSRMNGNYCAGVLEGLCHYHPRVKEWLVDAC